MTAFTISYGTPGQNGSGQPFFAFFVLQPNIVGDPVPMTRYMRANGPANSSSGRPSGPLQSEKAYAGKTGVLRNLYIGYGTASTADITFTVEVNGVSTTLTTTVAAGATTGNDTSHTVAINAGDSIVIRYSTSATDSSTRGIAVGVEVV